MSSKPEGLRYNEGKLRYDLVPAWAQDQYVKVLTYGSKKYPAWNWAKGMQWSNVLASMKRHIAAIEKGEDYDFDPNCEGCRTGECSTHSGQLHSAHVMCNAAFLTEYYRIHPQGDDRQHGYLNQPKIGLDIDEVLCDWIGAYKKFYNHADNHEFNSWYLHYDIIKQCETELTQEWYENLSPKISPRDIPFDPHCYITSRNVPKELTEAWLHKHGFPCRPVYVVGLTDSKADVAKKAGVEWFVDDVYKNFVELNQAGICCFLMDAPHNQRYNVGHKRVKSLKELLK